MEENTFQKDHLEEALRHAKAGRAKEAADFLVMAGVYLPEWDEENSSEEKGDGLEAVAEIVQMIKENPILLGYLMIELQKREVVQTQRSD